MTDNPDARAAGLLRAGLLVGPATAVAIALLVAPLVLLFRYSLNQYDATLLMVEAVTWENYVTFIQDPYYREVLWVTVAVAAGCTALCLLLGMPIAYRLARMRSRWKSAAMLLVIIPLFIGGSVRTVGWMILFSRGGLLDSLVAKLSPGTHFEMMYTPWAVVLGLVSIILPFVVLTLQSVFESIDVRLEEAASGLGASPARAHWHIVLPLAMRGVITGGTLSFILCMNAYGTPVLLGGPRFEMMAPLLYYEFSSNNNWPFAAALAFILMASTFLLTALAPLVVPKRYRL